jgi:uncharacterized protein (DUF1778 family)
MHGEELQERSERIDLRVPEYVKARIRAAAGLSGRNMSDFMIAAALREADEVVESVEHWVLDEKQSRWLLELLSEKRDRPRLRELLKLSDPDREGAVEQVAIPA